MHLNGFPIRKLNWAFLFIPKNLPNVISCFESEINQLKQFYSLEWYLSSWRSADWRCATCNRDRKHCKLVRREHYDATRMFDWFGNLSMTSHCAEKHSKKTKIIVIIRNQFQERSYSENVFHSKPNIIGSEICERFILSKSINKCFVCLFEFGC